METDIMHDNDELETVMRQAIAAAGFHDLSSEAGNGTFDADGLKVAWQVEDAPSGTTPKAVTAWCSIGTLDEETAPGLLERLLELNLFGAGVRGGHVGLYAPTRAIIYSCRLTPLGELPETTAATLETFTETAASFIREIESGTEPAPAEVPLFNPSLLWV